MIATTLLLLAAALGSGSASPAPSGCQAADPASTRPVRSLTFAQEGRALRAEIVSCYKRLRSARVIGGGLPRTLRQLCCVTSPSGRASRTLRPSSEQPGAGWDRSRG